MTIGIDHNAVRLLIRNHLLTVNGIPVAALRAWENREFKPPAPTKPPAAPVLWIRETMLPGDEQILATNVVMGLGIQTYHLITQLGGGTKTIETLAQTIKVAFAPTKDFVDLLVYRAERTVGLEEDPWYRVAVNLSWRAYGTRA